MSSKANIDLLFLRLGRIAPEGFFVALHIRFAAPLLYHLTYNKKWVERYTERAYALRDPIIAWGFMGNGSARWSQIRIPDPFNIMGEAREYGMVYGLAVSHGPIKSRTIASAARSDGEFSEDEISRFATIVGQLHEMTEPPTSLTRAQIDALRCIAEGDRHAAAAAKLNISESAFKARLNSARQRLLARTTAEALKRARDYRLL